MHAAKKINFKQFFDDYKNGFKIPMYQRPYSWKQENVDTFLDDIESVLDSNDTEQEHFLGLIVLSIDTKKNKQEYFDIIDGQQRITTILITLSIIRDILRDMYFKRENEIKQIPKILKEIGKLEKKKKSNKKYDKEKWEEDCKQKKLEFDEIIEELFEAEKEQFSLNPDDLDNSVKELRNKFQGKKEELKSMQGLIKKDLKKINDLLKVKKKMGDEFRFIKYLEAPTPDQRDEQKYLDCIFSDVYQKKGHPIYKAYHTQSYQADIFHKKAPVKMIKEQPSFGQSILVKQRFMLGYFEGHIFNSRKCKSKTEYKNYTRIDKQLRKKMSANKFTEWEKNVIWLRDFYNTILEKLEIIRFETESHEQAFNMFEVLNDRGLAVSATDLIKNLCLKNVAEKDIDSTFETWDNIFKDFSKSDHMQFLRYYYNSFETFATKKKLFSGYQKHLKKILRQANNNKTNKIATFLEDLKSGTNSFNKIKYPFKDFWGGENSFSSPAIKKIIILLDYTKTTQWYSLALAVFKKIDQVATKQNRPPIKIEKKVIELFELIFEVQSCLVLNEVKANLVETKYPSLAKELSKTNITKASFNKNINNIIQDIKGLQEKDPKWKKLCYKYIEKDNFSNLFLTTSNARMILAYLQYPLATLTEIDDPSLEHVCPQKQHKDWMWASKINKKNPEDFKELVNNPGNLLLLQNNKNSSIKAIGWKEKKKAFLKIEGLFDPTGPKGYGNKTNDLHYTKCKAWNKNLIMQRGEKVWEYWEKKTKKATGRVKKRKK